jgi:hypothetical protein
MSFEIYKAALDWLDKGFHLLPIQPNTKKQVAGFGLHQEHITNMQQAAQWFNNLSRFNLAVVAQENSFILDFDDWGLYLVWVRFVKQFCGAVTASHTEITPNDGAHVFLSGQLPNQIQLVEHVEIKKVVLVAPSIVGREYEIMLDGQIYSGSLDAALFPLSKTPPHASRAARADDSKRPPPNLARSKIDHIKATFSILALMNKHYPKTIFKGRGRFLSACCPFHKDTEESFYIDTERNLFGCHSSRCKAHGDVINFFARVHNLDNYKAIEEMSKRL